VSILDFFRSPGIPDVLHAISTLKDTLMATQAEHAADLVALKNQADKAKAEIIAKVAALEAAIANGSGTTPEVDAAMADLKGSIQGVDDLNQDAP
jgi:ABC-type transporter Mla subunit MlaD